MQELFASLSGHVQENIMGMRVLKAFAQEKPQKDAFEDECDTMRAANVSLNDASALLSPVIELIFGASLCLPKALPANRAKPSVHQAQKKANRMKKMPSLCP